jgi:ATP-binding cassette subfamily B protein
MLIFSVKMNKLEKRAFMANRKKIGAINSIVQDSLQGIRVVKSFANEEAELRKFQEGNRMFLETKETTYKIMGLYNSVNLAFQGALYIIVFFMGGYFIKIGRMDAGAVMAYVLYINMFMEPIKKLINFTELFQKGYTGFLHMREVMETEPDLLDSPNAVPLENVEGEIEFKNVSFNYVSSETSASSYVLKDLNFKIPKGKTVALVGSSGVGKTTICSLIPRFYETTEGEILIDGKNIKDFTIKSLRQNIGIVQQDVYIFNSSIMDNIAYGKPGASKQEIISAAKLADLDEYVSTLPDGYETQTGERGARFSGGQKQRLSIARVFLKNPKILILDEATSSLDNESERAIQSSLEELSKNRTTLIIAHRLSTVINADEILVLGKNGIEERGTHLELMEKGGFYSELYNLQFNFRQD